MINIKWQKIITCIIILAICLFITTNQMCVFASENDEVLCECTGLIRGCDSSGHVNTETSFGDLTADACCEVTGADIALLPSGDFGNHLQQGPVTKENLKDCLRNDSIIAVTTMDVKQLLAYLEKSISFVLINDDYTINWEDSFAEGFLQISGISVKFDTAAPEGSKVFHLYDAQGEEISSDDSDLEFKVASTKDIFDGQYDYPKMGDYTVAGTEIEIVSEYLKKQGTIEVPKTGRISLLGTREFVKGYGKMIGFLIGGVGILAAASIVYFKNKRNYQSINGRK